MRCRESLSLPASVRRDGDNGLVPASDDARLATLQRGELHADTNVTGDYLHVDLVWLSNAEVSKQLRAAEFIAPDQRLSPS
jgi:hypothetical protein